ncbi:esterase-like activity of phytase family protein [Sphingomonas sp. BN140010]|uniref:Esterase-like activity of phytase family protein n=1 Tax=Sphingomonas arvum TaxID=2992113 RepID=A0ABT3JFU7_9SPHN|nr:esterase-like activity of phytase family protein [Sphingomonas sp. BN140010]MCW3797949.1 esterase-like activity of phytase family protein [Sphingomonas sp. BN140010]
MNEPERGVKRTFSLLARLCLICLCFLVLARDVREQAPDRVPEAARLAGIRFQPLALTGGSGGEVRLVGAWKVSADDPRLAGLSALAVQPGGLLALADSGWLVDLPRPGAGAVARFRDLPAGPGPGTFKKNRDSEALAATGDGWWVTFEYRHSLWRFTPDWGSGRQLASLRRFHWPVNMGVEAIVRTADGRWLLLPENGRYVLEATGTGLRRRTITGATGGIADATRLPDGRVVVAVREIGWGIANRLAWLEAAGADFRLRPFARLPLGWLDNVEGLAAEPLPGGRTRLWAITDNDGWRRTLLLELEVSAPRGRRNPAGA